MEKAYRKTDLWTWLVIEQIAPAATDCTCRIQIVELNIL